MLKNYLITAFRNLYKHKLFTLINVFGLAFGLALCSLILGHISYELSFENFQENRDRIYRVNGSYYHENEETHMARVMAPLGPAMVEELLEVETAAMFRVERFNNIEIDNKRQKVVNERPNQAYVHGRDIFYTDSRFFDLFTVDLLQGDPATALEQPYSVLLTEKVAKEFFKNQNPVGRVIKINDQYECQVTGIIKDFPQNTQIYCDAMVSYATLERIGQNPCSWDRFGTDYIYLLLREGVDPGVVESKIPSILKSHLSPEAAEEYEFRLQPLRKIYFGSLGSRYQRQLSPMGEVSMIIGIGLVALFILIQAIANFINLSTAKSAERVKEVGVRKVFGAFKSHLVPQFLGESMLITLISMGIGIVFYELVKPSFDTFYGREASVNFFASPLMMLSIAALIVVVGILAGFYPALYLARHQPIQILQSKFRISSSKSKLRKVLVVFQFGLAIFFIICTTTIYRQMNYITSMKLGFDRENMLILDFDGQDANENCQLMKNEILRNHNVLSATMTNNPPGRKSYTFHGFYTDERCRDEDQIVGKLFRADYDFLSTFGLQITQGRGFSSELSDGDTHPIILTEKAVQHLEIDNPIGYKLYRKDGFYEVVGVVDDFHGSPLNWAYKDVTVIMLDQQKCNTLVIQLPPDDIPGSIAAIEKTWRATLPNIDYRYTFLDEEIDANYAEMRSQGGMFLGLAILSIIIACLGIFGLVAYTAEQKTREIGIRKVLGSSVTGIIRLLSKEFMILIAIANVIAWPLGYLLMRSFLQEFPFRVSIGVETFLFAGCIAVLLAIGTSSFQAYRAAVADPVKSLRYE
jgi:putative ABC transport system permease protein